MRNAFIRLYKVIFVINLQAIGIRSTPIAPNHAQVIFKLKCITRSPQKLKSSKLKNTCTGIFLGLVAINC